jgi:hypothetical protein
MSAGSKELSKRPEWVTKSIKQVLYIVTETFEKLLYGWGSPYKYAEQGFENRGYVPQEPGTPKWQLATIYPYKYRTALPPPQSILLN